MPKPRPKHTKHTAEAEPVVQTPVVPEATKTILIAEDEEAMAKVLVNKFANNGFHADRCCNGREALDKLGKQKYDLVLLDLLMPGVDGFAVLTEMTKTVNAKTPVFVLTNLGQEDVCTKVRKMGAEQCFLKSRTSLSDLVMHVKKGVGLV